MAIPAPSLYQINPTQVDWESESSYLFFNKRILREKPFVTANRPHLPDLRAHIWLTTSGRTQQKWVALSKKALLISAKAVNHHLKASSKDRWGVCLPLFHVGGLAITARAHLSKSPCFFYKKKWSATGFHSFLKTNQITLTSLVPTQVYDLVQAGMLAPPSLKAVVVGGESLSPSLYQYARHLKWPLLPSYGLTECGSQVATAELSSLKSPILSNTPALKILPHVQVKTLQGKVAIQSESLFTGMITGLRARRTRKGPFIRMTKGGWYKTGDKGQATKGFLQIDKPEHIKILGEKVPLSKLEDILSSLLLKQAFAGQAFLVPLPSEREGFQLALVTNKFNKKALAGILRQFNQKVSPIEKIKAVYFVPLIPMTGISKFNQKALLKKLGFE